MSRSPHLVIRASAGTGKTFRLTNRFLELLFDGVSPERILATTFTRKAAGEILDRVLERLLEASESEDHCARLAKDLGRGDLTRATCLQLLAETTRQLNAFQVRTIDSFFVHLTKLFALDLELPPGWSIADERVDDRLRSEALQEVLGKESVESLAVLIRELLKGKASRGIHQTLLEKIKDLRSIHLEANANAWDCLDTGSDVPSEVLEESLAQLESAELPLTTRGKPNSNWLKAVVKVQQFAAAGEWETLVSQGLGKAYLSGDRTFYKVHLPQGLVDAMAPVMARACHAILCQLRASNLAASDLIATFEEEYELKRREQGAYGFSDLPHALAPRTAKRLPLDERELDLWFRLDGRIDHLLLDEFQDTAPVQWRILQPIAEEITSVGDGSRSFFCVGDAKQSIYSFRQAEPRLLTNLLSMLPSLGKEENTEEMNESYRSSQVILDAVNRVFGDPAKNPVFAGEDKAPHRKACEEFGRSFGEHTAAKSLTGAAYLLEAAEASNAAERSVRALEKVVERVEALQAEAPGVSIGILTRTRKPIPGIINALRERDIDASGEGGNVLTDARSVLVFLSLLQLADFPDDSAAAFHVAESPFGAYVDLSRDTDEKARREKSRFLRAAIARQGLAEYVATFTNKIAQGKEWSAWDKVRFAQLQDLAFAFEIAGESRPSAFVDHVRKTKVEAPGGAAVRVMTIHSSKGLEFEAVILSELHGAFAGQRDKVIVDRPVPQDPIRGAILAPKQDLLPISTELRKLYEGETQRMVQDDLCVLYVAMTRAARRLEMIVPWVDPKKAEATSAANFLRHALGASATPDENGFLWVHENNGQNGSWAEERARGGARPDRTGHAELQFAPSASPRSLPRRSPSSEEGGGQRSVKEAVQSSRGAEIGTLAHAYLEDLKWSEDFSFEQAENHKKLRRASAVDRKTARGIVERAMKTEVIEAALSKASCGAPSGADLEVYGEADFSLVLDGELWNGSIDRLVLARLDGKVVWAEITDYKTDPIGPDGAGERVEHYRPQLERYAHVIAELHGLDPAKIESQLLFLGAGLVVAIQP